MLNALLLGLAVAAAAAPNNPDTFVYAQRSDNAGIDPARADDPYSIHLKRAVFDTLIASLPGAEGFEARLSSAVPSRANGLVSRDGLVWRFPIRAGVRFHDGSAVTAEDARYSLLRILVVGAAEGKYDSVRLSLLGEDAPPSPGGAGLGEVLRRAQAVVTAEEGALVLRLPRRSAFLLEKLAAYGFVGSKAWAVAHGEWDGTEAGLPKLAGPEASRWMMDNADGSGPFRLERWDRTARQVVLVRNDAYWRGPARLARVIVKTVPELTTRVLMLKNGDADAIAASVGEEPLVLDLAGVIVSTGLESATRWPVMYFNFRIDGAGNPDLGSMRLDGEGIPPDFFTDRDVRLGFAHAFDGEAYVRGFLRGRGRAASGVIPPGLPGYSSSGLEYAHDRALAERHFRRAWGGRVWEKGFKLSILVNQGSVVRPAVMNILKAELAAINPKFRVETHIVDWSTFLDQLAKGRATIGLGGVSSPVPDPLEYLRANFHSAGTNGRANHYANPALDAVIEKAEAEPDPAKRLALIDRAQRLGAADAPLSVLAEARGDTLRVNRAWVKGYRFDPFFPGAPETSDYYSLWKEEP